MIGMSECFEMRVLGKVLTRYRTLERFSDDKEWLKIKKEEIWKKSRDNARTPMQVNDFSFALSTTS